MIPGADPSERLTRLTPERLSEAPERAALAALRAVLEITERALLCANPELLDENWHAQHGRSHFASLRAAHRIMARGYALEREIARYEEHLQRLLNRSAGSTRDDLPF
jgi:hypothetical protein